MTAKTTLVPGLAALAALAASAAQADPSISKSTPGNHTTKSISMAPHPGRKGRHSYGAPIERPIAGRVQPKTKPPQ